MEYRRRGKLLALILTLAVVAKFYGFFGQTSVKTNYGITQDPHAFSRFEELSKFGFWGRYSDRADSSFREEHDTYEASELRMLSRKIWRKIWKLQNPEDCDKANLLIYDINSWKCGFGCTAHFILRHFLLAFYTGRTFVLKSNNWAYNTRGWGQYFMPLGKCDYNGWMWRISKFSNKTSDARVLQSFHDSPYHTYDWKIPRNILAKLKTLHKDPYAWWIAQFLSYELRLQTWFMEVLKDKSKRIPMTNSTVGIQIRWGDKIGTEGIKHEVPEYMNMASQWLQRSGNKGIHKTVYVATEQSLVWKDLEANYDDFSFIGAGYVDRNKELDYRKGFHYEERIHELEAILTDIYFLSKCPYVVCTFSSNICRLLYEMAALRNSKPRDAIQSLDDQSYWFIDLPNYRVIEDDIIKSDPGDMDVKIGDIFVPKFSSFDIRKQGYNYVLGTNTRTGQKGQVSTYRLEVVLEPVDFDL